MRTAERLLACFALLVCGCWAGLMDGKGIRMQERPASFALIVMGVLSSFVYLTKEPK